MAVTKLLHLKQSKGNFPSGSLIRCLHYIYNKEKTEDGLWTGSNCGRTAKEVYRAMMDTKYEWGKEWGRQGYHFIVAFEKGETDEQTACQVMKEWCQEYLGDQYEYAYAVHNDREHLHGHLVFNSVSRTSGRKYRYEKGDWKKYIQPVTDRICERHGLHRLTYQPPAKENIMRSICRNRKDVRLGKRSFSRILMLPFPNRKRTRRYSSGCGRGATKSGRAIPKNTGSMRRCVRRERSGEGERISCRKVTG